MTVHTEKGDVQVDLAEGVKILRVPPGSKDLKSAQYIAVTDISPGDRAVVLGHLGENQQTIEATRVVVMTKSDLSSFHAAEIQEWQTRGIEGVVKASGHGQNGSNHCGSQPPADTRELDPSCDSDHDPENDVLALRTGFGPVC